MHAYGYSVEEEVAVFVVTDYKVTFFMSRSPDVTDKRIRISEPVWWDQANPSARAYWLSFMQLAAQRHPGSNWLAACLVDKDNLPPLRRKAFLLAGSICRGGCTIVRLSIES